MDFKFALLLNTKKNDLYHRFIQSRGYSELKRFMYAALREANLTEKQNWPVYDQLNFINS